MPGILICQGIKVTRTNRMGKKGVKATYYSHKVRQFAEKFNRGSRQPKIKYKINK